MDLPETGGLFLCRTFRFGCEACPVLPVTSQSASNMPLPEKS
jgi:hypothetical protein